MVSDSLNADVVAFGGLCSRDEKQLPAETTHL
jgi:hypothetical protein